MRTETLRIAVCAARGYVADATAVSVVRVLCLNHRSESENTPSNKPQGLHLKTSKYVKHFGYYLMTHFTVLVYLTLNGENVSEVFSEV